MMITTTAGIMIPAATEPDESPAKGFATWCNQQYIICCLLGDEFAESLLGTA